MLGLAIGDALGATVEFMTPREIVTEYGVHDRICGGGWLRLPAGDVTDDTTMTLALGRAWLEAGRAPDAAQCAMAFDAWMRAKPVDIGNTVRRGIMRWRRHGSAQAEASNQAGNGAAMRCLPVALATLGDTVPAIRAAALTQARVTHHNPLSDAGTVAVVHMVQAALAGLGAIIFAAFLIEGAMADWSAVYLNGALGTTQAEAALGYTWATAEALHTPQQYIRAVLSAQPVPRAGQGVP